VWDCTALSRVILVTLINVKMEDLASDMKQDLKQKPQLVKLSKTTNQNADLMVFRKFAEEVVNTVICRIVNTRSR